MWRDTYPEFNDALEKNRFFVDMMVEDSLLKRALGFRAVERHVEYEPVIRDANAADPDPADAVQVKRKRVTKWVAPDVTACIFWLKNRRPDDWRDVNRHEFTGKDDMTKREQKRVREAVLRDPEALALANRLQRRVAGYPGSGVDGDSGRDGKPPVDSTVPSLPE
jgi:hypothetical protein